MKKKIINTLKSIGLILLILTFSSFMFVLLNIDVNSISDVKYLFYLSISLFNCSSYFTIMT